MVDLPFDVMIPPLDPDLHRVCAHRIKVASAAAGRAVLRVELLTMARAKSGGW